MTMGDAPNIMQALVCTDMIEVMGMLQRGNVDMGLIGGAQVDRFGNVNSTFVKAGADNRIRLPGSGGAADIASLAHRLVIMMAHEKRRFVESVDYLTSPGYGSGANWRDRVGLIRGGPSVVITTLGIFQFDPVSREMVLSHVHHGVEVSQVQEQTGWPLRVASNLAKTQVPTQKELQVLRKYDPNGFWTQKKI
jgi:glutaconate CoA-transferase, subunit B